ncbi:(deoxy)nucleoside triphosphate pyrophosphohydrolase [Thiohalorhabdus methylotrophus]|uniref:8-oxo-dGTP diphosphatase n=1 Tax=Thiohalorhabdus methylotrophus TaxID=3242694 RepID=A0ABV4TWA4_9GAMM
MSSQPELYVAVGLVRWEEYFLLGSRDPEGPGGGTWEFPGGKLEARESAEAALFRELAEELGIRVAEAHPYPAFDHAQRDYAVRLYPFLVTRFAGEPSGLEGQAIRWAEKAELWAEAAAMPGANGPLLRHLAGHGLFDPL